jgi:hypothetical protein
MYASPAHPMLRYVLTPFIRTILHENALFITPNNPPGFRDAISLNCVPRTMISIQAE